jgi:ribose 5-phosphate isomerase A
MDKQQVKRSVGFYAVDRYVRSGMKVGLGTGSTAIWAARRLGEHIAAGKLVGIKAVTTSFQTQIECENLGVPLFGLSSDAIGGHLDLAIDGADEVDPSNNLIKGGGAAHLSEKLVEYNSDRLIIVVDESKLVERLGLAFPLPIELIPEARVPVMHALERFGGKLSLRTGEGKDGPTITDHGNIVLDLLFSAPVDPAKLETELKLIPGVVEVGFFTKNRPTVIIGRVDGSIEERN